MACSAPRNSALRSGVLGCAAVIFTCALALCTCAVRPLMRTAISAADETCERDDDGEDPKEFGPAVSGGALHKR